MQVRILLGAPFCIKARQDEPSARELVHSLRLSRRRETAFYKGIRAAQAQYLAWLEIVSHAAWRNPEDVKKSYPKASILKAGRVVFNIKGNDYRLVARVQYQAGVSAIWFFGIHAEYDKIDAETV